MNIVLETAGRRFNRHWIFRHLSYTFEQGKSYAVLGPNGSGKSTLLQVISGSLSPSEGKVSYQQSSVVTPIDAVYRHLVMTAPYLDLIEEFSLREQIDFHFKFKSFLPGYDASAVIDLLGLRHSEDKALRNFSSGMKQRTKLALAFCSDTPVLLLDEPTTNLDREGVAWYRSLVRDFSGARTVIVCSNQEAEYDFCENQLLITDYSGR